MTPSNFIKRNITNIERNSRENWINASSSELLEIFNKIIIQIKYVRQDIYSTELVLNDWLSGLDKHTMPFFLNWLIKAMINDPSYVYATNFMIKRLNREEGDVIYNIKDPFQWQLFLELQEIDDLFLLAETVKINFPDLSDRQHFIMFCIAQNDNADKVNVYGTVLRETSDTLDKNLQSLIQPKKKPGDPSELDFVDIFKPPDHEPNAQLVKQVIREMNLIENNQIRKSYSDKIGDVHIVSKNVLAYVFAALKDPENGLCKIKAGPDSPQLVTFYREWGFEVAEEGGYVTKRNLSKVLSKNRREENPVYREFTIHYRKENS